MILTEFLTQSDLTMYLTQIIAYLTKLNTRHEQLWKIGYFNKVLYHNTEIIQNEIINI